MPGIGTSAVNGVRFWGYREPDGMGTPYISSKSGFSNLGPGRRINKVAGDTTVINTHGQRVTNSQLPRPPMLGPKPALQHTAFFVMTGVSRDNTGVPLGNCAVYVFDGDDRRIGVTVSNGSGAWSVILPNNAGPFWVRYYLAGSPNRAGTTDYGVLQG
jgi:hypothetical protein